MRIANRVIHQNNYKTQYIKNEKDRIKHVTVLGSGIMGKEELQHFANIGVEVLLLDIVPFELTEAGQKKGLTKENKTFETNCYRKFGEISEKQALLYSIKRVLQNKFL